MPIFVQRRKTILGIFSGCGPTGPFQLLVNGAIRYLGSLGRCSGCEPTGPFQLLFKGAKRYLEPQLVAVKLIYIINIPALFIYLLFAPPPPQTL